MTHPVGIHHTHRRASSHHQRGAEIEVLDHDLRACAARKVTRGR